MIRIHPVQLTSISLALPSIAESITEKMSRKKNDFQNLGAILERKS